MLHVLAVFCAAYHVSLGRVYRNTIFGGRTWRRVDRYAQGGDWGGLFNVVVASDYLAGAKEFASQIVSCVPS